jgi:hypothetical protein
LLTLNQIHAQIVTLANAHFQIAEVGMGTIAELQGKPDRLYPLLWLSNEGGSLEDNYKVDNIRLTMFGRVIAGEEGQDDDASEIEVLSDMQLILLDFLNYFHQQHGQEYVTDKAATLEHFTERTNDRTAGYSCVLELKQFYDWNKCQIPQSGASIPPSVDGLTLYDFCDQSVIDRLTAPQLACLSAEFGGADVTIQVDGNTIDTTPAGSTYSFTSKDTAGTTIGTIANPSIIADTNIRNQANDWTDTELAEGTYTLGLQRVIDSDGSNVDTVDYKPIADGAVFTCTPATNPSLAVALDVATIEFGKDLTITATPTDITPTNYYAFTEGSLGSLTKIGSQAGNVFNWAVDSVQGANTIYVNANDGSASCFNIVGEALTVTTVYMNNAFGGALGLWSATKRSELFASAWGRVRRSSDNDEADFSLLTGTPERFDNTSIASNSSPASHDGDTFATFIGATNGFVPNIYDQAGSSDGSQTTAASQPKIATTGTINTNSGYPALTFDGNDNFKVWNNTTAPVAYQGLSDAITIVAWVKPSAMTTDVGAAWSPTFTLVELRVNSSSSTTKVPFSFGFDNSRLRCGFTDNYTTNAENVISNSTFPIGNIRMVAVTINGDVVKLYGDGCLDIEQTLTVATGNRSVGALNSSLIIGSRSRDGGQADSSYYSGDVMDIAIYDSVLSDDYISKLRRYYLS